MENINYTYLENKALAKANLILQPPENSLYVNKDKIITKNKKICFYQFQ